MHKNILILAERQAKKLDHDLKNTWRVPVGTDIKVNNTIDNYRHALHELLKENEQLKKDLKSCKNTPCNPSDPEEGIFLTK